MRRVACAGVCVVGVAVGGVGVVWGRRHEHCDIRDALLSGLTQVPELLRPVDLVERREAVHRQELGVGLQHALLLLALAGGGGEAASIVAGGAGATGVVAGGPGGDARGKGTEPAPRRRRQWGVGHRAVGVVFVVVPSVDEALGHDDAHFSDAEVCKLQSRLMGGRAKMCSFIAQIQEQDFARGCSMKGWVVPRSTSGAQCAALSVAYLLVGVICGWVGCALMGDSGMFTIRLTEAAHGAHHSTFFVGCLAVAICCTRTSSCGSHPVLYGIVHRRQILHNLVAGLTEVNT